MAAAFNKILIPVDFSLNTELAITKAAGLIGWEESTLHLIHIIKGSQRSATGFLSQEAETALKVWVDRLAVSHPAIKVRIHILHGASVQKLITSCASMLKPDLIIIGKQNNKRRWLSLKHLSPATLARKTNCPVWTAKPGALETRTRIIVIPIRDSMPDRKLEWGVLLARKFKAQIHLLAIQQQAAPKENGLPQIFLRAYHHLREHLHHPIEYTSVTRRHPAKAALRYAEKIMADMILLNAATESDLSGITGSRHISDLLTRDSKIQILDLQPYN